MSHTLSNMDPRDASVSKNEATVRAEISISIELPDPRNWRSKVKI